MGSGSIPRKTAEELVNTFYNEPNAISGEGLFTWAINNKESAKQIAILCCKEIISELEDTMYKAGLSHRIERYKNIITEINDMQ